MPKVTLTGRFVARDGVTPVAGSISSILSEALLDDDDVVQVTPVLTVTNFDANGQFSVSLDATNTIGLHPRHKTYTITEQVDGEPERVYGVEIDYRAKNGIIDLVKLAPNPTKALNYQLVPSLLGSASGGSSGLYVSSTIQPGNAVVANNVAPPGIAIPSDTTLTLARVRVGTAPTGADLVVNVLKSGELLTTVTVAAGELDGTNDGLALALVEDDILTFDVTQIGSTIPGADVAIDLEMA